MNTYSDWSTTRKSEFDQDEVSNGLTCSVNQRPNLKTDMFASALIPAIRFDMRRFDVVSTIVLGVLLLGTSITGVFLSPISIPMGILTITISFLIALGHYFNMRLSDTKHAQLVKQETVHLAAIFWLFALFMVCTSIIDMSLHWVGRPDDLLTLTIVRSETLENVEYRSILGKISGVMLLPFAAISCILYFIRKKIIFIIIGFVVCSLFSLLMGGRGSILFMLLLLLPILALGSKIKMIGIFLLGIGILSSIYAWREDRSLTDGILSVSEYFYEGWHGFGILLTGNIDLLTFRLLGNWPDLNEYIFQVNDRVGNIYTGVGNGLYLFGFYGYIVFVITIWVSFLFLLRLSKNNLLWALYFRLLMFLYFAFQPFHDLIIFYISFTFALGVGLSMLLIDKIRVQS